MFSVENALRGYHEYKDNWPEGSNFASASVKGWRYFKIDIFVPEFTPQISTHKNGDKSGWVKYWQMTFNSPNSPKFSPATILLYTVCT